MFFSIDSGLSHIPLGREKFLCQNKSIAFSAFFSFRAHKNNIYRWDLLNLLSIQDRGNIFMLLFTSLLSLKSSDVSVVIRHKSVAAELGTAVYKINCFCIT
jgi:hypothetical protein